MRRMIRFAGLVPILAFAAACSGAGAPTGPAPMTANDPYEAMSGEASQMLNVPCKDIAAVDVSILAPTSMTVVQLRAVYRYEKPQPTGMSCAVPPKWSANRKGLNVHPTDPFRASIERRGDGRTTVTAKAPNGKHGSVTF
jgi:hypothetical protein